MLGIYFAGKFIPIYGIMISVGVLTAGIIGLFLVKKNSLSGDNFLLLSSYCLGGGMIGAKMFYLILNFRQINWSQILEIEYFRKIMQGGYVFYGGLIGGVAFLIIAAKIHHLNVLKYVEAAIPCLPVAHASGRIGCHFAGCCYGIPYEGVGHIIYHMAASAPVEVPLFPVQLFEASINFIIAGSLILYIYKKGCTANSIRIYIISYSIARFFIEYLRFDVEARGKFLMFSTSQWISIMLIILINFLYPHLKKMDNNFGKMII